MGNQYRSGNWLNEDNNSVRDVRALRYLLANNSANNSSFVGINNHNIVRGSRTIRVQSIHELINLPQLPGNTNTTGHDGGVDHHYPAPTILPRTTTINNYNDNRASSSSSFSFLPARPFGSTLTTINRNNNISSLLGLSSMLYPNIGGQPARPAALYNNSRSGGAVGNNSNISNPILNNGRINNNVATTTAGPIRNDDLGRSLSLKRSRSPDQFLRGDSSGQGSQDAGTSSRRRIIPPICLHQDNHNMSSSTSSTSQRHYSGNSVISNMLNQNMVNQAIADGAGPSSTSMTQSHINSLLESHGQAGIAGNLPYQSNSTNEPMDINRFLFPPRQDHPPNNFINRRYDPSAAFASTRGSLVTTQAATPFQIYNNFMPLTIAGSGSSFRSTGSRQNHSNNNNFDFFESFHREIDDVFGHSTISIQEHARVLPIGRVYRSLVQTFVPVQPSSSVPSQPPLLISDPSMSNYRLNPPPGQGFSNTLEANRYVQTSSTLTSTRSENRVRLGGHNHIFASNFPELMAEPERNRRRGEVYIFLITCEYFQIFWIYFPYFLVKLNK
jgi:hypothetical protein